ncbi:hypothetical protein K435DRAFT_837527 [Dendrothele bispora CBS 962.96]|uniref:Uncharacterized protein n=1 Tax=Dendrothele bispora (strain CBS 962.96) TaxID=1314807 RepID=A0A4S8MBT0_DENBC|nr:hypothetical protein K435DRAFT_837527 [Dendrothele bispora CBS 962.96]
MGGSGSGHGSGKNQEVHGRYEHEQLYLKISLRETFISTFIGVASCSNLIWTGFKQDSAGESTRSSSANHVSPPCTPEILLLSGTGPNEESGQVGADLSFDSSYGGKHLIEHPPVPPIASTLTQRLMTRSSGPSLSLLPKAEPLPISNIKDTVSALMNGISKQNKYLSETSTASFLSYSLGFIFPFRPPSSNLSVIWLLLGDGADANREAYIRKNLITVYHPAGTAKMSSGSDTDGCDGVEVEGQDYSWVLGLLDASIFDLCICREEVDTTD